MEIYLILLTAVLILGRWMPQSGPCRKWYILIMAVLHTALCGLRHPNLTGDLMKYHWDFLAAGQGDWLDLGKNPGLYLLMKGVYHTFGGNFQVFLFLTAAVSQIAFGWIVWKVSPAPWLSYLTLHCLGFYSFGFSAVKQALGMAFVMLAFLGIAEGRPKFFLAMVGIAGLVHLPMLAFMPAYLLTRFRVDRAVLLGYVLAGAALFLLREPAAKLAAGLYYGEAAFTWSGGPGWRMCIFSFLCCSSRRCSASPEPGRWPLTAAAGTS